MAKRSKHKTSVYDKFLSFDMFGASIGFNLNGKKTYDTCAGAFVSLLVVSTVACYAQFKIRDFFDQPVEVVSSIDKGYYSED